MAMLPEVQHISGDNMPNTNNTFPTNSNEYFNNKLDNLSNYQWLFDKTNPFYFPYWVSVLINLIHRLSLLKRFTFFTQKALAVMAKKSDRTLRVILQRLVDIEVLQVRVIKKNKQYKVNWGLLHYSNDSTVNNKGNNTETSAITSAIYEEDFPTSHFDTIASSKKNPPTPEDGYSYIVDLNHLAIESTTKENIHIDDSLKINQPILEAVTPEVEKEEKATVKVVTTTNSNLPTKLDPIEVEIKEEFESITGTKLNIKRDYKALKELKELAAKAKDIVKEAFQNVKQHLSETGRKIYSLSYILVTAKNILRDKLNPKKDNLSLEAKRNLEIGGKGSRAEAATPEELQQATLELQTLQKHEQLREELFNNLDEADKQVMIQDVIEIIKTKTPDVWQKIKPKFPWFDKDLCTTYVVNKVKDLLLKEHLEYQAFLASS